MSTKRLIYLGREHSIPVFVALSTIILTSCAMVKLTGHTIVVGGKLARETVELSSLVVEKGAKLSGAGIRYFAGKRVVNLEREGNSFFVRVHINGRHKKKLLLDTGATDVQISRKLARELKINVDRINPINCILADGSAVPAAPIVLEEVRIGGVKVKNVDAVVLLDDELTEQSDGLLGMSFLNNFNFELDMDRNLLILQHLNN